MKIIQTLEEFAELLYLTTKSDRWGLLAISGTMGEGKSCFSDQLLTAVAEQTRVSYDLNINMTYKREELKKLIDGKEQLPEYSCINADELVSMFFKRNWYDKEQIDGVELLNKCRDRHLIIAGCIPNFWDLDSGITPLINYWVHIHKRGIAWVFKQSSNIFDTDAWNRMINKKKFAKNKHPYKCEGFVCEIHFGDWTKDHKLEYYKIRNVKRKDTEGQREKEEKFATLKQQRNSMIKLYFKRYNKANNKDVIAATGLKLRSVQYIKEGII